MEALETVVEEGGVTDVGRVEHEGVHDNLGVKESRRPAVESHSEQRDLSVDDGAVQRAKVAEHRYVGSADAYEADVA